jgi:phosphinothricin acetyltransferase
MTRQSVAASIEQAGPGDFLDIAALDRIAWLHTGEPYIADGEHVWRVWCQYATVILARWPEQLPQTGKVAGALLMFPTNGNEQFLHKIMVHPDCRGRGLGRQLMQAGLAQATQPVLLTVDPQNQAAIQLYQNFGFQVREHIAGYYRPHEHRYLMVAGGP